MKRVEMTYEEYNRQLLDRLNSDDTIQFTNIKFINFPSEPSEYSIRADIPPILFENCCFDNPLLIGNNHYSDIKFVECEANRILLHKGSIYGHLAINNSFVKDLQFAEINIHKDCQIIDSEIEMLRFGDTNIPFGIKITSTRGNKTIEKIRVNISNVGSLNIESININELILEGAKNTPIIFKNVHIEKFINSALEVRSKMIMDNVKPLVTKASILDFANSKIHQLEILNSNLKKYEQLTFLGAKFDTLVFSNIAWKTIVSNNIQDSIREHRFLKNEMSEQGNKVDETFFLAYELNAIRKSLQSTWKIGDRIILFFNWFSNFYRLNIWLPILWFFASGIGIYYAILCDMELLFLNNWGKVFTFMNPTHRVDFLDIELSNFSLFLDFAGRVFLSYFLYQFVQAFRRHSVR